MKEWPKWTSDWRGGVVGWVLLVLVLIGFAHLSDLLPGNQWDEHLKEIKPLTEEQRQELDHQLEEENPESAKILKDIYGR